MDAQLDARVQFPASFPDTFKNVFDLMNEDEDHAGLFVHMLEDKIIPIPRPTPRKMHPQRGRCGGSQRSSSVSGRDEIYERSYRHHLQQQQQQQQQQQDEQYQHRQHLQQLQNLERGRRASISSGVEFYRESSDITEPSVNYPYMSAGRVHMFRSAHERNAQHHNNPGQSQLGHGPMVLNPNVSSSSSGSLRQLASGTGGDQWIIQAQPGAPLQLEVSGPASGYCPELPVLVPPRPAASRRQLPVNGASDVAEAVEALERMELHEEQDKRSCFERSFDCDVECANASECASATDSYDVPTPPSPPKNSNSSDRNSALFETERAVGAQPHRLLPTPPVHSRRDSVHRNPPVGQAWVQQEENSVHSENLIRFAPPMNLVPVGPVQEWNEHLRNFADRPPQYEEYIFAAQHPGGSRQDVRRASGAESSIHHPTRLYGQQEVHPLRLHSVEPREHLEASRVLTIQQAMRGAVSPQYGTVGAHPEPPYSDPRSTSLRFVVNEMSNGGEDNCSAAPVCNTPKRVRQVHLEREPPVGEASPMRGQRHSTAGTSAMSALSSRLAPRQRRRTSSMPAECRRPPHAEMRQAVKHAEDQGVEYYRLRSFSITSNGVCNLGDSLRSRRSRSNNSVTSGITSYSGNRHNNRNTSGNIIDGTTSGEPPTFKIAMLGSPSVGKSALSFQFTTSDYICAYDLSLEMEYGQKTVSVLLDDVESDIEVVDHPACEMSTEAFCATYNIDLFVVVYSVLDVYSFRNAERVLHYLRDNDMLLSRGAILVGNKADLERHRSVPQEIGHKVATEIPCKFIETSAALCHNVNELLVGVVAQAKLNPQRLSMLSPGELERVNMQSSIQNHRRMHLERQLYQRRSDFALGPDPDDDSNRPPISLKDILNVGESDREDTPNESEAQRRHRFLTQFELLAADIRANNQPARPLSISPFSKRRSIAGCATSGTTCTGLQRLAMDDSQLGGHPHRISSRSDFRKHLFHFNCQGRVKKMTARTKVFVSSLLRLKASNWLRRRTSSSCTDLFAI